MKKQVSKLVPEKIQILSVRIIKANLEASTDLLEKDINDNIEGYSTNIGHEMAHNDEDKMVRVRLFLTIEGVPKPESDPIKLSVDYGLEFHFRIENLDELCDNSNGEHSMHHDLALTLFTMAYSTSRGIILERTQGTILGGVLLPVIDPMKVFKDSQNG